jgi:membrane dipeptidase
VIASHSAVRALAPSVTRDMDDELLEALKKNGGVIQVVGFTGFLKPESPERTAALKKLQEQFFSNMGGRRGGNREAAAARPCPVEGASTQTRRGNGMAAYVNMLPEDKRADFQKQMAEIDAKYPAGPRGNVKDLVDHIDYAVKKVGIDHVGISSDFDGGGGIDGWNSTDQSFNVTLELVRRGYSEEQIGKLWSGNLLRVWGEVDKVAKQLQKAQK